MAICVTCNLCERPGTFAAATESAPIACNVREFQRDVFTVWRCSNCRSLHSKEDAQLDRYYANYPLQRQRLDPVLALAYANRLRLLERRGLRRNSRLLDFGCGSGTFVEFLRKRGYAAASGYDAYVAQYRAPHMLEQRYDFVVSYDVVEHAEDPRACIERLAHCVEPGGVLVIGTPNAARISFEPEYVLELHQPYHRHILSEDALLKICADLGLALEHVHRRLYIDTPYPGLNARFVSGYASAAGGVLDALLEPVRPRVLLSAPRLCFWAFFGFFFPARGNMLVSFRKPTQAQAGPGLTATADRQTRNAR